MPMNPRFTQMVVESRIADMQRATAPSRQASHPVRARAALTDSHSVRVGAAAARRAIGWFLVGVGLRLAVSRPRSAAAQ
jgi:hypothetical protein